MSDYSSPLELAKAELGTQFNPQYCSPVATCDDEFIKRLHIEARDHGFMEEMYFVETTQGFVFPAEIPAKTEKFDGTFIELRNLTFSGELEGFHKFSIGKNIGVWCLRFSEATLAPGLDKIPETDELWIPGASIKEIQQL